MLKRNVIVGILLFACALSFAQTQAPVSNFKINGVYNAWGYSQQNFFLGRLKAQDDHIVQMLRLNLAFTPSENTKVVTRFDMAQGWWGVDNELPTGGSSSRTYNNKDTKFITHVDQAYFWVNVPKLKTAFTIGRAQWLVGNRLLIDNNYDGVQADISVGKNKLKLGWAEVWEGYDGLTDKTDQAPDLYGNTDARDADLLLADYAKAGEKNKWNLFGFFYKDRGIRDGTA